MKIKLLFSVVFLYSLFLNAQNLVAYYPFNGNPNDESGNNNNGTVNGATLTIDRFGNPDSAYLFDGVDDYIQCLQPGPIGTSPRTISFWAKTDATPKPTQTNAVLSYGGDNLDRIEINLNAGANGLTVTPGNAYLTKAFDNTDAGWHFYTVVFEGGAGKTMNDFKFYADGQLLTTTAESVDHGHTINTANTYPINIGRLPAFGRFFKGTLDEIKFYDTALTQEDIINEYRDLVAFYPFNGNANDESGNNHHGTVNGATLTTDRFGIANSAYHFDGNDIINVSHSSELNINGALSISVWVKPTTVTNAMILGKSNYVNTTNYLLRTYSTGLLQFEYRDMAYNNNNPLIAGQWNHIAVVSDINNIKKIYINNVLASHTGGSSPFNTVPEILTFGGASYGAEYFNGSIDDIRIYKSTLTDTEITSLYTNNTLKIEKIENVANSNFYVYNNTIFFKNTQNLNEIKTIEVYNLLGQKVFNTKKITEQIDLNTLPKGIYILKVENTIKSYSSLKFIVE